MLDAVFATASDDEPRVHDNGSKYDGRDQDLQSDEDSEGGAGPEDDDRGLDSHKLKHEVRRVPASKNSAPLTPARRYRGATTTHIQVPAKPWPNPPPLLTTKRGILRPRPLSPPPNRPRNPPSRSHRKLQSRQLGRRSVSIYLIISHSRD